MPTEKRAVFFDRDGTLMEEEDHCDHPSRVRAIKGAADMLEQLHAKDWLNIVITNQSGIGRGYFTMADYEAVNTELFAQLRNTIDGAYCCPDHPKEPTPRRKPGIGMVLEAQAAHGIDPKKSWFVGDKGIDIGCGRNAGCRTILVLTGYGEKNRECGADFIAEDVVEAVKIILSHS